MNDSVVRFDGEVWPAAGSSLEALSHRLKSVHGELEARERYAAAEVVDAYHALLQMSRRAREERVKKIRLLSQEREASVR